MTSWWQKLTGRKSKTSRGKKRSPLLWGRNLPRLETLEARVVPDSGGATGVLTSAGNLQLNPTGASTSGINQIIPNVKIQLIFLSDPTHGTSVPASTQTSIKNYFTNITSAGLIPYLMAQYGNTLGLPAIGNGTVGVVDTTASASPDATTNGSPAYSDNFSTGDHQLQLIIRSEILNGHTGASDGLDNLYFIFTPPGDAVVAGTGSTSINAFLGYHSAFRDANVSNWDYYAVIPDESSVNATEFGSGTTNALRGETVVSSHEMAEAITDDFPVTGWVDPYNNLLGSGEIGDQAANEYYVYDGHEVQYLWSNALVGAAHAPSTGADDLFINQVTPPAVPVAVGVSVPVATITTANTSLTTGNILAFMYEYDTTGHGEPNWNYTAVSGGNGHFVLDASPTVAVTAGTYGTLYSQQEGLYVGVEDGLAADATAADGGAPESLRYAPFVVTATAPLSYTADSGSGVNNFVLKENTGTGNFELRDNGLLVFTQPIALTTSINITADPAIPGQAAASVDNSLTIDESGGIITNAINFDGGPGSGTHNVTVTGAALTSLTYDATGANAGDLVVNGNANKIKFTDVETVTDSATTGTVNMNIDPNNNIAGTVTTTFTNSGANSVATLSNSLPSFTFGNPTTAFVLTGHTGNDSITFTSMGTGFNAALTVNGHTTGSDVVNLNATLNLGSGASTGNVVVTATTINVAGVITTTAGTPGKVTLTAGGAITASAGENIIAPSVSLSAGTSIGSGTALTLTTTTVVQAIAGSGNLDLALLSNASTGPVTVTFAQDASGAFTIAQTGGQTLTFVAFSFSALTSALFSNTGANLIVPASQSGAVTAVMQTLSSGNIIISNTGTGSGLGAHAAGAIDLISAGTITQTGSSSDEALSSGTVSLTAAGNIGPVTIVAPTVIASTSSGFINVTNNLTTAVTATLTDTGAGAITFAQIGGGAVSVTATANAAITLSNTAAALTATSVNTNGGGNVSITTTTSGDIALGTVTAAGQTITATSAGAITDTGTISGGNVFLTASSAISESGTGLVSTTGTLTTSSVTGTTLGGSNSLGTFNATNTTSGNVSLNDPVATLIITGITETGGGSVTVVETGAISVTGTISAGGGGAVNLTASAALSEAGSGLVSTTGTLTTSSVGGTTLGGANTVGGFNATNTTSGNISLTNTATTLIVSGISEAGGGNATVNNTGAISITGTVSAGGGAVNLTSTGALSETGSGLVSTTGTLTTNSAGGTALGGANAVGTFQATNTTSGNVSLTNTATTLTITGISESGGGNVTVTNTGAISVTGTVSAGSGGAVNLTASGALSESGSGLVSTTGTLTTSSVGGATLGGANTVGGFNATNTTSGNISLTNIATTLIVSGISQAGGGNVTVSNTGAISVTGTVSAGVGTVFLTASTSLSESGAGLVNAGGLNANSVTGTTLTGANTIAVFVAHTTTSGNISLTNTATTLTISGILESGGGSVTVTNTGAVSITGTVSAGSGGAVNLTATSAITESGSGLISTTGTLTTSSSGGTTLNGANAPGTFNAINTTSGNVSFTNTASPLIITGISEAGGGNVTVTNTGAISVTGTVSAGSGGAVNLTASGAISESGSGLVNTTGTLTTSSAGDATLNGANTVGGFNATDTNLFIQLVNTATTLTVTGISEAGASGFSVSVINTGAISVTGTVSAGGGGGVSLTASTALSESGSGLVSTTGVFVTSSATGTTLGGANTVGEFHGVNTASGNFSLINSATSLLIDPITEAGGGSVTVTNTGAIVVDRTISAGSGGAVNLTAGGALSETGPGLVSTTGTLTTSSVGGTTLGGANTVGGFNATNITSGNISLTNTATTLTVIGISEAGGGSATVTNTGALSVTGAVTSGTGAANGGSITLTTTTGLTVANTGSVSSASGSGGSLIVSGAVTLNGPVTVGAGTVTLNGGGSTSVDIVIGANETIAGPVSLTAQRDIIIEASLTTTGAGSNIALSAGNGASGVGAGGVWVNHNGAFTGQVTSAGTLSITGKDLFATAGTSTDAVRLEGPVSAAGAVTLDNTTTGGAAPAGAGTFLNTTVTTSAGAVLVNNPVTLTGSSTVSDTGGGNVTFANTIDGGFGLTVNTAGVTTFAAAVGGSTALASVTTDAPGSTDLNGGSVTTTGPQTYNDAVTLSANTTLTSTGSGNLTFASTVNGAFSLTVSTGGTTTFGGAVGGTTPLTSLVDQSTTTDLNTGTVTTTQTQTYNDAVVVADSVGTATLSAGENITLNSGASITTHNSNLSLQANTAGTASGVFNGISITTATIQSTGTGNISLQGEGAANNSSSQNIGILILNGGVVEATGSGNVTLNGTGGNAVNNDFGEVLFGSGTRVSTVNGALSITGTGQGSGSNGEGMDIQGGAVVQATGTGNVTLVGTGANGTGNDFGVNVTGGGVSTNSGALSITGNGGGSGTNNPGVAVQNSGGSVTTVSGALSITGTGSGNGTENDGVIILSGGVVQATGTGTVTVLGTGGNGSSGAAGVVVENAGTVVSTVSGALAITGTGGGTGSIAEGIDVEQGGVVEATGSGNVTLNGTGANGTSQNEGVRLFSSGTIVSVASGALTITGTGQGSGTQDYGVEVESGAVVQASGSGTIALTGTAPGNTAAISFSLQSGVTGFLTAGTGNVTLTGDIIDLATNAGAPTVTSSGASQLLFQPLTSSRPIILGGSDVAGSLVYTDTDNAAIAQGGANGFSLVTIGRANSSGAITTGNNVTFGANAVVQTPNNSSGGVTVSNTLNAGANSLTVNSGTNISTSGAGLLQAGNLALQAVTGIGSVGTPLNIAAGSLTSTTAAGNGNQFLKETGTAKLSAVTALNAGTGSITLTNGTFQIQGSAGGNAIADTSPLVVNAPAVLDLGGNNEAVDFGGSGTVTDNGANATLTIGANNGGGTWSGVIQDGTGHTSVNKIGTGTEIFSGANTYSGGTQVSQGTLQLGANNSLPVGGVVTIGDLNGDFSLLDLNSFNQTVAGLSFLAPNSTSTTLTLGTGTLTLNGNVNYGPQGADNYPDIITATGAGHIDLGGAVRSFTIFSNNNAGGLGGDLQIDAPIQDGGIFLTAIASSRPEPGVLTLGAVNTYTLGTTVAQGQLYTAVAGALPSAGVLTLGTANSATAGFVDLMGNSQTVAGITLAAGNTGGTNNVITTSSGTPSFTVNDSANFSYAGLLSGPLSLVQTGTGTVALTAANTYTGTTTVNGGTLQVDGSTAASSAVAVNSGMLDGTGTVGGTVAVNNGGTVSPGDSPGTGILNTGSITFNAGATFLVEIGGLTAGTQFDQLNVNGTANLGGAITAQLINGFTPAVNNSVQVLTFTSKTGDFSTQNGFNLGNNLEFQEQFAPTNSPTQLNLVVVSTSQPTITPTSGSGQTAIVNTTFAMPLVATILDGSGNPIQGVQVTFTAPNSGASGTFSGGSLTFVGTTGANGQVTTSTFTANTVAGGPYIVTATATVSSVPLQANFSLTNTPAAASQLFITQQPSPTATAGVPFATQPVVKEEDPFGNVITTDSTHTVTAARGSHGTAALQGSQLTVTLANGVATFSGLSYNVAETMNILFTTNAGGFTTTSNDVVVSPAAASQLFITQQPSPTATAGVPFATQPVVKEEDPFGNVITTDSTHTVTAARGSHGTAALQGSQLTVTLANGVATFSGLSYNVAETMNILFTTNAGGFTTTSNDVVVSPAAASQLFITQQPSPTATAGVPFATQPVVKEEDPFGNVITTDSTHTVTAARGSHGTAALQGSQLTVTLANGVATFSGLSYNVAETMNILFTTNAGGFTTTSNDVVVSPAAASQLFITQQPSPTATAGVPFATQPVVKEEDPFGNVITTDSTHTVTAARGSHGTAALQGSQLTVTLANGVATFSGLSYNVAETMNILFTTNAGGFTTTSNDVVVSPAAASQLFITQQPSPTATAGVPFATQPVVKEEDPFGNVITTDSTHTVTAARGSHGTAALQGSQLTVTLANGVATFSGLSYNVAETMNILFTTNAGGFTTTSNDVVVSPAAASQLFITQQPSPTATAGVPFATQPVVKEEDPFGNVITTDSTHTVTAARGSHGTAALQGSQLTVTLANGVATFSGLSYNVAETMNILFTTNAGGFTTTSNDVVVSPAAAYQLMFKQGPTNTIAGVPISPAVTVQVLDQFHNLVTTDSSNVTMAIGTNAGGGTLSGMTTEAASGGVATFSTLSINKTGTGYTLAASDGSLSGATSGTFNITPAAANHFMVAAPASTTAGNAFSITVFALDPFGNLATGYSGTVHFTKSDNGAGSAVPANYTFVTGDSGVHTFSNLVTLVTAGTQIVTATDTGNASITGTSNNITVTPAAATHFLVSGLQAVNVGTAYVYTVTALDPYGNTDTNYGYIVGLTASPASATISNGGTVSMSAGVGTATVTFNSATTYNLTASGANPNGGANISGALNNIVATSGNLKSLGVIIDDGSGQHSMIRTLTVTLQGNVNVNVSDFTLTVQNKANTTPALVTMQIGGTSVDSNGNTEVTLVFISDPGDGAMVGGSLFDGQYVLSLQGTTIKSFWRLFGDALGTMQVTNADQTLFNAAYGSRKGQSKYNSIFDYDSNGLINGADRGSFQANLGMMINAAGLVVPIS